ncbi:MULTISPECIES: hypothetical protein [unclassified Acinetobacter]|uniref:hypothetical protein n=1 Tax=unclassified Acinetobacter TaxID=196816 RepID=UPI00190C4D9F|nr:MULTISPECIES: hypothetical protein [unclassified Acinetobacter]MBK0062414.1 hypothetical protein [Acinetobacter sp. S55]MBK0066218.1 hypothetical protein [Acinetobacter sp. S54]
MNSKTPYESPRQRVWNAIRNNRNEFTIIQVAEIGAATYESTRDFVSKLTKAGFVQCTNVQNKEKTFELIKDCGYAYPSFNKDGQVVSDITGNKAMWNTLRITKMAVNAYELAKISSTDDQVISLETANNYLMTLYKAGYLKKVKAAKVTGGKAKYILLPDMNTGPKPPQIQRTKHVFDPNINTVMFAERPELDEEIKHGTLLGVLDA